MTARADTAEQRLAIYHGLHLRNRLVSILRVGLPILGLVVLVAFFLQIFLASLASQFGIGKVTFTGDTVMVDTPSYSGVMDDGDIYRVSAQGASTAVTNLNVIDLKNAELTITKPDGSTMQAKAAVSAFNTIGQILTVPGLAEVSDSAGNSGTLENVVVSIPAQSLKATGQVKLTTRDGSNILSNGVQYTAKVGVWNFGKATLSVPEPSSDGADDGEDSE